MTNRKMTPEQYAVHNEREKARQALRKAEDYEGFRALNNASKKRWREKYPEKEQAHAAMHAAVRKGTLIKSETCDRCGGHPERVGKLEGSHFSYEPEMWLVVEWLCRPCHNIKDFRSDEEVA